MGYLETRQALIDAGIPEDSVSGASGGEWAGGVVVVVSPGHEVPMMLADGVWVTVHPAGPAWSDITHRDPRVLVRIHKQADE